MDATKPDQMAALDELLAAPPPADPLGGLTTPEGTVLCQVCDTAIDTTTGAPVEDPLASSQGVPPPLEAPPGMPV